MYFSYSNFWMISQRVWEKKQLLKKMKLLMKMEGLMFWSHMFMLLSDWIPMHGWPNFLSEVSAGPRTPGWHKNYSVYRKLRPNPVSNSKSIACTGSRIDIWRACVCSCVFCLCYGLGNLYAIFRELYGTNLLAIVLTSKFADHLMHVRVACMIC